MIVTGGAASTFSIDQSSAQIRLVTALDYETTTSYVIVVVATDGGGSVVRTLEIKVYYIVRQGKIRYHCANFARSNVGVAPPLLSSKQDKPSLVMMIMCH